VAGAFALFGSFSIHGGLHLNFTYLQETVNAYIKEAVDECAVARTMSFMDGELHFSVGVMRTKRIKLG